MNSDQEPINTLYIVLGELLWSAKRLILLDGIFLEDLSSFHLIYSRFSSISFGISFYTMKKLQEIKIFIETNSIQE